MTIQEIKKAYETTYLNAVKNFYKGIYETACEAISELSESIILNMMSLDLIESEIHVLSNTTEGNIIVFYVANEDSSEVEDRIFPITKDLDGRVESVKIDVINNTIDFEIDAKLFNTASRLFANKRYIEEAFGEHLLEIREDLEHEYAVWGFTIKGEAFDTD